MMRHTNTLGTPLLMAYIYNSQDARLDIPNPYRIENHFRFMAAGILLVGGLMLLLSARQVLKLPHPGLAWVPLALGVVLLLESGRQAITAMSRLRFFFGRGHPAGLASELSPDQTGSSESARHLQELVRHNSLSFPEPSGALNGVLYSLLPNLIYAPVHLQQIAQRQFHNGLAIAVLGLSLIVSVASGDGRGMGWLGLLYVAGLIAVMLHPLDEGSTGRIDIGLRGLVLLTLASLLGPVAIELLLHDLKAPAWAPSVWQAGTLMLLAEAGIALFFSAVIAQTLKSPPQASMAMMQGTVSLNAHPAQLTEELSRQLQTGWVASLPNRCYARRIPEIPPGTAAGSFSGELLEECQPLPSQSLASLTLSTCFTTPHYRWLASLNVYGLLLILAAVIAMVSLSNQIVSGASLNGGLIRLVLVGFSAGLIGRFCFKAGGVLWSRFDFTSRLTWVEMSGNFQSAQVDYGNALLDRFKTQKEVINIESMTLRTWVVELDTVSFGKDTPRSILGMRGLHDAAQALQQHLTHFADAQTLLLAPSAAQDAQRAATLDGLNQRPAPAAVSLQALLGSSLGACCVQARAAGSRFCPTCGQRIDSP